MTKRKKKKKRKKRASQTRSLHQIPPPAQKEGEGYARETDSSKFGREWIQPQGLASRSKTKQTWQQEETVLDPQERKQGDNTYEQLEPKEICGKTNSPGSP